MHRVLVVEDSAAMRGLIASIVESIDDCEADEAENGFEALRQLPRHDYDLVVTDINMPNINGLELLNFIRTNVATRGLPVLIVTSEASSTDRARGMALGANDYITKPFKTEELSASVRRLLHTL